MNVTFYKNVTKLAMSTALPAVDGTTISCSVYGDWNVKAPVIVLSKNAYDHEYNYAYIPDFGRYYYIMDWAYRRGHYYASLAVDVCTSYREQIFAQSAYVTRSASQWDGSITDSYYPNKSTPQTAKIPLSDEHLVANFASGTIVLGVIGGGPLSFNGVLYYLLTPEKASALFTAIMSTLPATVVESGDLGVSENLAKMLYNPAQYIVSAMWVPVEYSIFANGLGIGTPVREQEIYCGYFATGVTGAAALNTPSCRLQLLDSVTPPKHPQHERGAFLGAQPYSRAALSFMGFPDIEITDNLSQVSDINAYLTIDGITGGAEIEVQYRLAKDTGSVSIVSNTISQLGVPLLLSQVTASFDGSVNILSRLLTNNNMAELGASLETAALGSLTWGLNNFESLLNMPFNDWNYEYVQLGDAVDRAGKTLGNGTDSTTITNGIASSVYTYSATTKGSTGTLSLLAGFVNNALIITYQILVDDDVVNRGRPLCKTVPLSTLSGYTMIASPLRITGTVQESATLNDIASRGVYLE